ncbi:MAG: P27 family phage terminase small subunit [Kordiimonadaceae bacterium]|nr:P27 family phage terminase small subunit [Kordiimonadaceae bacterium]
MAKGRKPTAPHLKTIQGGRDRKGKKAAVTSVDVAGPVLDMSDVEQEHFTALVAKLSGVGGDSDTFAHVITLCAKKLAEIELSDAFILDKGFFYEVISSTANKDDEAPTKLLKKNPAVSQRAEAIRDAKALLAEMGLTQTSIGKIGGGQQKSSNNFGKFKKPARG